MAKPDPHPSEPAPETPVSLVRRLKERLLPPKEPPYVPPPKRGQNIAVFACKGGLGKTTIAVNLALALHQRGNKAVVLFDGDFSFGDVGVQLNQPATRSILNLVKYPDRLALDLLDEVLVEHESGVRVLLGSTYPREGERVAGKHIAQIIDYLASSADFVVADCPTLYDERTLTILRQADVILLIVTPEIGPLKNTSHFFDIARSEGLLDRLHIVLNRSDSDVGIPPERVEYTLQHDIAARIVSGGRKVVLSTNRGKPLVLEDAGHPFSHDIFRLADYLEQLGGQPAEQAAPTPAADQPIAPEPAALAVEQAAPPPQPVTTAGDSAGPEPTDLPVEELSTRAAPPAAEQPVAPVAQPALALPPVAPVESPAPAVAQPAQAPPPYSKLDAAFPQAPTWPPIARRQQPVGASAQPEAPPQQPAREEQPAQGSQPTPPPSDREQPPGAS